MSTLPRAEVITKLSRIAGAREVAEVPAKVSASGMCTLCKVCTCSGSPARVHTSAVQEIRGRRRDFP